MSSVDSGARKESLAVSEADDAVAARREDDLGLKHSSSVGVAADNLVDAKFFAEAVALHGLGPLSPMVVI